VLSDLACRSRRQRSQRRRDGKLKAEEEQQSEINSGSPPEKQAQPRRGRPLDITSRVNPGQEPVTTTGNPGQESAAANASSSAHDASSEKTIVNASSSTVAKRFSVSPVVQEASPIQNQMVTQDQKQVPKANTSHHSGSDDDGEEPRTTTWSRLRTTMTATTAWRRRRPKASSCPAAAAAP